MHGFINLKKIHAYAKSSFCTYVHFYDEIYGEFYKWDPWGLIYNRCVRTKPALKEAYASSYTKGGISKNKLDGKSSTPGPLFINNA